MEEEGYGKKGLSSSSSWASRLSPLAQPFTMNHRASVGQTFTLNSLTSLNQKPFTPSPSNHLDPFDDVLLPDSFSSNLTLGGDQLLPVSPPTLPSFSAHHLSDSVPSVSASPLDDLLEFSDETSFSRYPLEEFHGYFDSLSVPDGTEFDALVSTKSSVSTHAQCSSYGGRGSVADGKNFVFSNGGGPLACEGLLKQDSKLTPYKVSTASDVLSLSMLQNTPKVPMLGLSANGTKFPPSSHILSKNVEVTGNSIANNKSSSGWNIWGKREIHGLLNADSKEVHQDKSLADKGNEVKNAKSVPSKVLDPLAKAKSEAQATVVDILDNLIPERSGTLAGISTKASSKMLVENESDLDSPCWKGIQNSAKSPGIVSESLSTSSLQNESEAGTSLNPQAPQFFPSHAKGSIDYLQNNFVGGFPSLADGEYSAFDLSYKEQPLIDSYKVGSKSPGLSNAGGYRHSNDVNECGQESAVFKNSKNSSTLSPPQMIEPCLVNGFFTSKGMPVKGVNDGPFADGILDAVNQNPSNPSVLAAEHIPNLSSSGVGALNDCSEILQSLTQSLSKCPKINVAVVVNTIRYLSDLLVQNCSNDLDSLNEHEHFMIQHIINSLSLLVKPKVGEKTPMLDLLHTGSLDYRDKSTVTDEHSNMEFQVIPRTNDLVVRRELDGWSDLARKKTYSHVPTWKIQDIVPSSRDTGSSERGNSVVPVLRNALKENQQIDEEIQPQALLNLWLEAEGALCSMKYENYILRMKLQKTEQR